MPSNDEEAALGQSGPTSFETSFSADSLDDLLREGIEAIFEHGALIFPSKGECKELFGVRLQLLKPRARLSRSEARGRVFSGLGELLWYLRGTNDLDVISYYVPRYRCYAEDGQLYGGYGPRLLNFDGINQLQAMVDMLLIKPDSRQAVIQLFDHTDLVEPHTDVPCTCVLQFILRASKLHLLVYMRSNDVYIGLPHDVFCFTMLQEVVASALGADLGTYMHLVGSFHLYAKTYEDAQRFIREGYFSPVEMPPMPAGDPWPAIDSLLEIEQELRQGADPLSIAIDGDTYWDDLARLIVCSPFASNAASPTSEQCEINWEFASMMRLSWTSLSELAPRGSVYSRMAASLDQLDRDPEVSEAVLEWGCPIPYFGQIALATIATVGINPSNRGFLTIVGASWRVVLGDFLLASISALRGGPLLPPWTFAHSLVLAAHTSMQTPTRGGLTC